MTSHLSGSCRMQYTGHADAANVEKVLRSDLKAMFERRFNKDEYEQYDEKFIVQVRACPRLMQQNRRASCQIPKQSMLFFGPHDTRSQMLPACESISVNALCLRTIHICCAQAGVRLSPIRGPAHACNKKYCVVCVGTMLLLQ